MKIRLLFGVACALVAASALPPPPGGPGPPSSSSFADAPPGSVASEAAADFALCGAACPPGVTLPAVPTEGRATLIPDATPVLLVPGWGDGREELEPLRARFVAVGWDSARVGIVEFRDPVGSNREHAREIAVAAAGLRQAIDAPEIDIVAHSMGGLALRYHLLRHRPAGEGVRRVVFLATPHFGTWSSLFAWGDGAREMRPGSDFLLRLTEGEPLPPNVTALTIRTPFDLHILPGESTTLPGVDHIEICCPSHAGLLDDDRVFEVIENFLVRPPE